MELEKNRSSIEDGFEVHDHFDGSTQKRAAAWLSEHGITVDYGYVQTDLALLELRKRGGCDFIHVTNCVEINLGRPTHRRDVLP